MRTLFAISTASPTSGSSRTLDRSEPYADPKDDPQTTADAHLVAPNGKGFAIGDTLTVPPPGGRARWVVVAVADDPRRPGGGIVTVDPFEL